MLRPLALHDPARLAAISRRQGWDRDWAVSEDSFRGYLKPGSDGGCIVAGDPAVAFACYRVWGGIAYLGLLLVDRARRGEGIGARLLEAVERETLGKGASTLKVDALLPAVAFYTARGFMEEYAIHRFVHRGVPVPPRRRLFSWNRRLPQPADEAPPDLASVGALDRLGYPAGRDVYVRSLVSSARVRGIEGLCYIAYVVRATGLHVVSAVAPPGGTAALEEQVRSLMAAWPGRRAYVSVPETNRDALDLWRRSGFSGLPDQRRIRLTKGDLAPDRTDFIYSL